MKKVIGLVLGLVPVSVSAECVPVPDCTSIGYTETSCDGDSLKCPFDTTKLKCIPCDSSFRHSCTGENIKNPIGSACNNKYAACECIAGATFTNGECVCDTSCDTIGNIYYSDRTCNSCKLIDKTPVGIVAYNDTNKHLIVSLETSIRMSWSTTLRDNEGNTIIIRETDLPKLNNYISKDLALTDYNGLNNTQIIVEAYGENTTDVSAVYCYNYAPTGLENSKGKWYLPAAGELYDIVYNNKVNINKSLSVLGINSLYTGYHWSSTERNHTFSWDIRSDDGYVNNNVKASSSSHAVTCLLAI